MSERGGFDLDHDSRRALEFDELLDWVASFARTFPGAARVRELLPADGPDRVRDELDAVEETRGCLAAGGRLVPGALPDPVAPLQALKVEGAILDPLPLRDLASFLSAEGDLRRQLLGLEEEEFPHLRRLGWSLPDLHEEAADILHCIDPDGRVSDDASPELRRIRAAALAIGERLRGMLESYFRDPGASPVVQDDFITQRNGRFVIPVRTDTPRPVRGIVHATSSSGATQFVEPMETLEVNNDLVRLREQEAVERERILLGWSDALRYRWQDVAAAIEGLAVTDSLQARALFAEDCAAVRPVVAEAGPMVIDSARHPILDRRLRKEGGGCVPLSIRLDPSDQVLVLSGPNTGGKTVAIKTLGLAVLMAQSGIPFPASAVRLPLYRQLRSDIGDRQSIEADLSTYSAHIRAVVGYLRDAAAPALFLFDEIGGGTEPVEGAALAQSVLEALQRPGMTTVATTHQGALKAWAFTTEGAVSAAMEFDEESLRPTYRILMGAAGVSAGLDIAERLGIDPKIVAAARARLGAESIQSESYLGRLRDLTADLERRHAEAQRREEELVEERRRLEARAELERDQRRRRAERELDRALEEFRALARKELTGIRDKRERKRAERDSARLEQRLRMERERRVDDVAPGAGVDDEGWVVPQRLTEGMSVYVVSVAREGTVQEVRGDRVEVKLGRVNFSVKRSDLRLRRGSAPPPQPPPSESAVIRRERGPQIDTREAPRELKLLGKTIDEALPELDKFLDEASLSGYPEVRVIHGHGTGRLRAAVRRYLRGHVHVASSRPGKPYEGGDGATVVQLK